MSEIKPNQLPNIKAVTMAQQGEELPKVLTLDEVAREEALVRLQAEKVRLQREQMELEKLQHDIEIIRAEKAKATMSHGTVEEALDYAREDRKWHEENCTHMKGGSSESLLNNAPSQGQDASNYAMIQHTLTTGVTFRMCQRCGRTWFPKDADYRWAMSRPTKNSPSTGCPSPGLVRNRKSTAEGGVRLESEIPHKVQPMAVPEFGQSNVAF
ncbi:MAG: hypothetical protein ACREQ5_06885 [Candidatus Dormibacteria bacterium]